jgi:hypothetical protein
MKPLSAPGCREDVISTETWNGGDGTISFNHLQQREPDTTTRPATPLEEAETTDPWGITAG